MTNQEWDTKIDNLRELIELHARESNERFSKLEDSQLVMQRLMELNERKWDERFEKLEAVAVSHQSALTSLISVVEAQQQEMQAHQGDILELRAAMTSLVANIDRFIQGRGTNGH